MALVEAYAKEQGLWHEPGREARYSEELELDLSTVVPSLAGPKRPQDRVALADAKASFREALGAYVSEPSLDNGIAGTFPASDPVASSRRTSAAGAGGPSLAGSCLPPPRSPWRTGRRSPSTTARW